MDKPSPVETVCVFCGMYNGVVDRLSAYRTEIEARKAMALFLADDLGDSGIDAWLKQDREVGHPKYGGTQYLIVAVGPHGTIHQPNDPVYIVDGQPYCYACATAQGYLSSPRVEASHQALTCVVCGVERDLPIIT